MVGIFFQCSSGLTKNEGPLLNDHAVGQVLGVVLEEFGGGSRTVGELQLLQVLQLDQPRETCGRQQGTAYMRGGQTITKSCVEFVWTVPLCLLGVTAAISNGPLPPQLKSHFNLTPRVH